MNKRGQFFLIAALIISVIIVGLGNVYVSIRTTPEDVRVQELSEEINFEASRVIDAGLINPQQTPLELNIRDLMDDYAAMNPESDFAIYYGDESSVKALSYEKETSGTISFNLGGSGTTSTIEGREVTEAILLTEDINCIEVECTKAVTIELKDTKFGQEKVYDYTFKLKKGQNFFIVVKKERENERIVKSKE